MGKLKEKFRSVKESRIFKVLTNKFILATAVFAVWIVFFDTNNLINFFHLRHQVAHQEQMIRKIKNDIATVKRERRELNSNKDSLEKFARERYYFHKEGETVYLVDDGE